MDSWIKIGTKIDNSGLDKDIKELENKIDIAEKKKLIIKTDVDSKRAGLNEVDKKLSDLKQKAEEYKAVFAGTEGRLGTPDQTIARFNYNELQPQIKALEAEQTKIVADIEKQAIAYDNVNNQAQHYKNQIDKINKKLDEQNRKHLDIGKNTKAVMSTIKKWAFAIIGVRGAYAGIRSIMNNVLQYNKQLSTDMQYMGFAISKVFEPVIQWIINALYKILQIVGMIIQTLTGKNIFAKSGVKDFQKAMAQSAGSSKKIKDNISQAGFDEMNTLQDNSSSGGTSVGTPSMDLSKLDLENNEGWLKNIKQLLIDLLPYILAIAGAILAVKSGLDLVKAVGIGTIIFGVVKLIQDLIAYLQEGGDTMENFGKIITDIGIILLGFGILLGNIPLIIAGALVMIVGYVVKNWDTIKDILDKAIEWLDNSIENVSNFFQSKIDWVREKFGIFGAWIWQTVEGVATSIISVIKTILSTITSVLDKVFNGFKKMVDGVIKLFKGDLKGGIVDIMTGIGLIIQGAINLIIGMVNMMIDGINLILSPIRSLIVEAGNILGKGWTMSNIQISHIPLLATGGIVNIPNRGVNIGGAIAGEAGAEGVIPLTDSQAMETLGEAIGRYITINANIVNSMNGRVISRELKRINNETTFAHNG